MKLDQRIKQIRLILSDVDGVLTDGGITFDNQGIESKRFHVRDGQGIRLWQNSGGEFGIITARSSHIVKMRASELDIELIRQGVSSKLLVAQQIIDERDLKFEQVCYVGDDLGDRELLQHVGLAVAVSDAVEEVREVAHYITKCAGGQGAIREVIELILKGNGSWKDAIQSFYSR